MAKSRVTVYQVPTEAGTHFPGQRLAPERILEGVCPGQKSLDRGLRKQLEDVGFDVHDGVDLLASLPKEVTAWRPASHTTHGVRNHDNALSVCHAIADSLASLPSTWPVENNINIFLGGDCSITPAILTGLHHAASPNKDPKIGILYTDGDVDLTLPSTSTEADGSSHILDSMVLTHLTRRPGCLDSMSPFTKPDGSPLVNAENIVLFGFDPLQPSPDHFAYLLQHQFRCFPRTAVRADPLGSARAALDWLKERVDVVVVHFDVDVVDSAEFPLANYPHYAGLAAVEAWEVLGVVLGDEMVKAVVVTEVNPGNDPEGWMVGELVEAIGKGLERRLSLR